MPECFCYLWLENNGVSIIVLAMIVDGILREILRLSGRDYIELGLILSTFSY